MTTDFLEPQLDLLRQEYVLIQAWKKTATYIRYHNWYSDTLELDRTAINLRTFLAELSERLQFPEQWEDDRLRIVPAPKTQRWRVSPESGAWEPIQRGVLAAQLRPLAYVSLKDQVIATALMLCLADRVETRQGDPRGSKRDADSRKQVVSYGNRLFCDTVGASLRHRWGSVKLYRAYSQDYRVFLSRPEMVADDIGKGQRVIIVHSDLRQFYDRVRPDGLAAALQRLQTGEDDPLFFKFASQVLDWRWHAWDSRDVAIYAKQAELEDFSRVALPQGLVSAGFFANVVLLSFDDELRRSIGSQIAPGVYLNDVCRYVDDLRVVVTVERDQDLQQVKSVVSEWLQNLLEKETPGLKLSSEKTKAVEFGGSESPLVRQSTKMNRIQSAVSGGFDAIGGEEILESIQGLIQSQHALSQKSEGGGWRFSPLPDVRDDTVARFAAARFRRTFRSLRPLLEQGRSTQSSGSVHAEESPGSRLSRARTQSDLDDEVRAFALGLIERWVEDPSNVRLLRIGLDLWPDTKVLRAVLDLLRPFTAKGGRRKAPRRIAWYCLSEILRAGATETGFVEDDECLPVGVDLTEYRNVLRQEATRLVPLSAATIPWYLRQQALLFLAAHDPAVAPVMRTGQSTETKLYREMIRFLRGDGDRLKSSDFATLAVLSRRAFVDGERAVSLTSQELTPARERRIAEVDPSFALELVEASNLLFDGLSPRLREDLCLVAVAESKDFRTLSEVVIKDGPLGPLRNELALLRFAVKFLRVLQNRNEYIDVLTPGQIRLRLGNEDESTNVDELEIVLSRSDPMGSLYRPPDWCSEAERWRFQLGFLLRFILARHPDFTRPVRSLRWKEGKPMYRMPESHWYLRLYGMFNGQPVFGNDWLPISDWTEGFLTALLHWPGCRMPVDFNWVMIGIEETLRHLEDRISKLVRMHGSSTRALFLPMVASRPTKNQNPRPLRACVVQTVIPTADEFSETDLTLSASPIRRMHRNHVSAALAAVERMLALRETHRGAEGRLDWLILPELAVHPHDVVTHLVPFARAHKTIVLTGLTYEELFPGEPLVNSALWIIPEWTDAYGLQLRIRRQGKYHLAPNEEQFNKNGGRQLQGFRPCQWLVGYPWTDDRTRRHVWLTASVCYDATDLGLAADLRKESDILAIPALNKDVQTFDQMALALHYHMFQLVVVANNGHYGGSNAYWPSKDVHVRQVFHLHGQPQASIAFLEIEDIPAFLERRNNASVNLWKYPPAGLTSD